MTWITCMKELQVSRALSEKWCGYLPCQVIEYLVGFALLQCIGICNILLLYDFAKASYFFNLLLPPRKKYYQAMSCAT